MRRRKALTRDELRKKSVEELTALLRELSSRRIIDEGAIQACMDVLDEKAPLDKEREDPEASLKEFHEKYDPVFPVIDYLVNDAKHKAFYTGIAIGTGCAAALIAVVNLALGHREN